jgi:hypothetical protein
VQPRLLAFLKIYVSSVLTLMSGALSVPFTALGVWAGDTWARAVFLSLAFTGVLVAAYRIWAVEHERTEFLLGQLASLRNEKSEEPFDFNMREALDWRVARAGGDVTTEQRFDVFEEFRRVAAQGRLTIWGRERSLSPMLGDYKPHIRVPAEHWNDMGMNALRYIMGDANDVRESSTETDPFTSKKVPVYYDLMVKCSELELIFQAGQPIKRL